LRRAGSLFQGCTAPPDPDLPADESRMVDRATLAPLAVAVLRSPPAARSDTAPDTMRQLLTLAEGRVEAIAGAQE
jgi:hypothetical protein